MRIQGGSVVFVCAIQGPCVGVVYLDLLTGTVGISSFMNNLHGRWREKVAVQEAMAIFNIIILWMHTPFL